ncbi:MAG: transaldolase [Planctomycetota bacterium]
MNKLIELSKLGQSIWYDNVERKLLKNGEIKRLITEDAITGVTSNPSIFEKAITSSTDYDEDIYSLAKAGKNIEEIYEAITIKDIIATCDLLQNIYIKSGYCDGYVSIEVSPDYAYNTEKTLESARRIFRAINRPNILIKVPGTKEGFEAVKQLIAEGINVNITLLFSQNHYVKTFDAYIQGLKQRLNKGLDINNIFSVASVFISRIDTAIDKIVEQRRAESVERIVKGKTAVANAKIIYQLHNKIISGNDFQSLQKNGAKIQKIVWASTSTKNPAYADTMYVDELIAPDTINTVPPQTILAFKDHGKPAITTDKNPDEAQKILRTLHDNGIDTNKICDEIQKDGIKAFKDSYYKALKAIENKIK